LTVVIIDVKYIENLRLKLKNVNKRKNVTKIKKGL